MLSYSDPGFWGGILVSALLTGAAAKKWWRGERTADASADTSISISEGTRTVVELLTRQVLDLSKTVDTMRQELYEARESNKACEMRNIRLQQQFMSMQDRVHDMEMKLQDDGK